MILIGEPAGPGRDAILQRLRENCPEASLEVNDDGSVRITTPICTELVRSEAQIGNPCRCICDLVSFDRTVRIRLDPDLSANGGGREEPVNINDSVRGDSPSGFGPGTDSTVFIENANRYMAQRADRPGEITAEPDWLILAHELCGHALRSLRGDHPENRRGRPGYRPDWHDGALSVGRLIRAFRGLPPIIEPPFIP